MSTNESTLRWSLKDFYSLKPSDLYRILRLRSEVFVVEQNCVFLDADNNDQPAWHLMGWQKDLLVAYSRILPAGKTFPEVSIGRVVTAPQFRRTGAGRELMNVSLVKAQTLFGSVPIRIGAQLYLKRFYESFGFLQASEIYLEDGIQHIEMLRPAEII